MFKTFSTTSKPVYAILIAVSLLLDRELPCQNHQQECNDGWEEREERPHHHEHRVGYADRVYHRIAKLIGNHIGTSPPQEKSYQ